MFSLEHLSHNNKFHTHVCAVFIITDYSEVCVSVRDWGPVQTGRLTELKAPFSLKNDKDLTEHTEYCETNIQTMDA